MSRIDANLATQIGDTTRPQQIVQERHQQASAAITKAVAQGVDAGQTVTAEDARAIATRMKQVVEASSSRRLSFDIDKDRDNEFFMQVTDQDTGEVIQQIPSKEMRDLHTRLQADASNANVKNQAGLLLNKVI